MVLFENTIKLRGFLGRDAEVPPSDGISEDASAVLSLATMSGTWDIATNEWKPHVDWHCIVCLGSYFCGFTRGMRRGDYLEIDGELRALERDRTVVVAGKRYPSTHTIYAVHATRIQRLERPPSVIDTGEGG